MKSLTLAIFYAAIAAVLLVAALAMLADAF